jgi:hypothetical protein
MAPSLTTKKGSTLADEDDFLLEDPFSVTYNLDREFGYQKDL